MNRVGVDLLQRRELESFRAYGFLQQAAIFANIFARIPLHETEIQNLLAFEWTDSTGARAESVDEPRKFAERCELKNLQAARTVQLP